MPRRTAALSRAEGLRALQTLSSESRLRIVYALAELGEVPVADLVALSTSSRANVSTHLGRLRLVGLVSCRRRARGGPFFSPPRRNLLAARHPSGYKRSMPPPARPRPRLAPGARRGGAARTEALGRGPPWWRRGTSCRPAGWRRSASCCSANC